MKKVMKIAVMMAMLMLPAMSFAADYDEPKNEISVSYGWAPITNIADGFACVLSNLVPGITESDYIGAINLDYTHHVAKWLSVGANVSYSQVNDNLYTSKKDADGVMVKDEKYGKDVTNNFTVMPTVKFNWYRREHVTMYSRLSAGVTFQQEKESYVKPKDGNNCTDWNTCFNFQASPFGIEAGSNNIRAFSELGIGQAGIFQLGLRYRF